LPSALRAQPVSPSFFLFSSPAAHRDLHSFPTRRSSDLELPTDSKEPRVREINVALFPVLVVTLSGDVEESVLYAVADDLQDRIEALPGVLEASIQGKREEIAEIIVDPARMDNYGLSFADLARLVGNNNQLVASEDLDTGAGRFAVKVPGLIESIPDILQLP